MLAVEETFDLCKKRLAGGRRQCTLDSEIQAIDQTSKVHPYKRPRGYCRLVMCSVVVEVNEVIPYASVQDFVPAQGQQSVGHNTSAALSALLEYYHHVEPNQDSALMLIGELGAGRWVFLTLSF